LIAQWRAGGVAVGGVAVGAIAAAGGAPAPYTQRCGQAAIQKLIYVSTTGVFGDWQGAWIDETVTPRPSQPRSLRRLNAEQQLLQAFHAVRLRVPGIYAADRLPIDRIRQGKPCLEPQEDSYSNHIHADDLAMILWLSLFRAAPARLYAICDNEPLAMGDWFDHIARLHGLTPPPRASREAVKSAVSPMMWSFMQESRRIHNRRMHAEIRPRLKAPGARSFLEVTIRHHEQAPGKPQP
jgi:nucleoside-diphosphate-sugar epimerase